MTPDDFNTELDEPPLRDLDRNDLAVNVTVEPVAGEQEGISTNNPFISPVYW